MTPEALLRMNVYQEGQRAASRGQACPYTDWRAKTWAKGWKAAQDHYAAEVLARETEQQARRTEMYENWNTEEFFSRFKIVCLKCGSDDVKISGDQGWGGTDVTGGDPATLAIGCNACKQNDFDFSQ